MSDQNGDSMERSTPSVEVRTNNGFNGVFAVRDISRGERLIPVRGIMRTVPTRYSIQVGKSLHIDAGVENPPWMFLNHGCDPNVGFLEDDRCFTALRNIRSGEEIRFNYLTTEWEMAEPFACHCGAEGCFGWIAGFKNLDHASQIKLIDSTAGYIKEMYSEGAII